ncbi:hypothetical protein LOD99_8212 [Oopsacas minuta]|uniref:Uncharacterized protein n=1 Tax=Oopsacas minuta TaxID=111878 RepID=A0AAV7JHN9_9METZ|nr:hypothetical protein LOD99_8212 [Oopsacas minuta]
MTSLVQCVTAITQLGYNDFDKLKVALDNGDRRRAKSVWGKLSILIFNKNKPNTRAPLYLKWKLNRNQFQDYIKQSMEGNSRKLNSDSGTDIFQLAVEYVSTSVDSLEREVSNSKFLGLLEWLEQPELYSLKSTLSSSPQTEVTDTLFWTYIVCDNLLWLDALKFLGSECPRISGEFMLINWIIYEECKKFNEFLYEHLRNFRLVKRDSCLLEAWILVGNINCRILDLFGSAYLIITVAQLEEFLNFALFIRENMDLIFSFHSTLSEKLGTVNSSKIPLLVDSHPNM